MKYTLQSLNNLKEELDRTNVISKDFKTTIMGYALDVAREAREVEQQVLKLQEAFGKKE